MQELSGIISENLKQLRADKKLSLDNLSKITGVSKSMLGQLERGEVNPTVTTIWKIANGLKVSFTALMKRPQSDIEVISKRDATPLVEDDGRFRNYPLFPFDETRRFEIYAIELDPGSSLSADPHPPGTQEFMTVFSGEVTVTVKADEFTIGPGDAIRFKADAHHAYHNGGNELAKVSMVIYYPE